MTATTDSQHDADTDEPGFLASGAVSASMQAVLVDLIELHLQAKHYHWNVVGQNFRDLHLQLDEIVDVARTGADAVAERMRALGAVPDGGTGTVARTTALPPAMRGEHDSAAVVTIVARSIAAAVATVRRVRDTVDAEDPASTDLLHAITLDLEKHAWMLRAEVRTPRRR